MPDRRYGTVAPGRRPLRQAIFRLRLVPLSPDLMHGSIEVVVTVGQA